MEVDGDIVAVATIAPDGEAGSGEPTIVGLYTLPKFRGQGFGKVAMEIAIRRMQERGFSKIRVDTLTKDALAVIAKLPAELRSSLVVHDQSSCGDMLPQ